MSLIVGDRVMVMDAYGLINRSLCFLVGEVVALEEDWNFRAKIHERFAHVDFGSDQARFPVNYLAQLPKVKEA